jgi:hypothetical protein
VRFVHVAAVIRNINDNYSKLYVYIYMCVCVCVNLLKPSGNFTYDQV